MAVVFNSFSGWSGQIGTNLTAYLPGGVVDGDYLLMVLVTESTEAHTTPDGWRLMGGARNGADRTRPNISIYHKIASGEPESYNVSVSSNNILGHVGIGRFSTDLQAQQTQSGSLNISDLHIDGLSSRISQASQAFVRADGITVDTEPGMILMIAAIITDTYPETFLAPEGMTTLTQGNYYNITTGVFSIDSQDDDFTGAYEATASTSGQWSAILLKIAEPHTLENDTRTLIWMGI